MSLKPGQVPFMMGDENHHETRRAQDPIPTERFPGRHSAGGLFDQCNKDDRYRWIQRELVRFRYRGLCRADKGVVIRYLVRVSGYSRQQLTRLIAQYRDAGSLRRSQRTAAGFIRRYTDQDIRLLAAMDERHETPCGPAVKKLCERACAVFGQTEYRTLAGISVSHLYKLRIEFTKSRSRHSNDNALAESKNAAIVRKQFGYSHIAQHWASLINSFNQEHLNLYINFHRPCFFPETRTDAKGKERKIYRYENLMTPYDKFKSLANAKDYLKPGTSFETLDQLAHQISDNEAADQLQKARKTLFKIIHGQGLKTG